MRTFLLTLACIFAFHLQAAPKELMVYIGTYTKTQEQGIHWLKLDMESGKLTAVGKLAGQKNPSFLAIHPNRKFLYAVNEIGESNSVVRVVTIGNSPSMYFVINKFASGIRTSNGAGGVISRASRLVSDGGG